MQGPTRIYLSLRHHSDAGLVAAVAASTLLFAATPFLIPEIASDFELQLGVAGLVSTAQVGMFAAVVFVAGRTLRTSRRYLIVATIIMFAANLGSAFAPTFFVLVALRMLAGGAAGIMVWLGWAKAMRVGASLRNVAAAGPAAVFLGAPLIGWFASSSGIDAVFIFLAVIALPAAVLPVEFAGFKPKRSRAGVSRSNVVLVVALGFLTMAGSAMFVYTASLVLEPLHCNGIVGLHRLHKALADEIIEDAHCRSTFGPLRTARSKAPSASSHSPGERTVTLIGRPTSISTSETAS